MNSKPIINQKYKVGSFCYFFEAKTQSICYGIITDCHLIINNMGSNIIYDIDLLKFDEDTSEDIYFWVDTYETYEDVNQEYVFKSDKKLSKFIDKYYNIHLDKIFLNSKIWFLWDDRTKVGFGYVKGIYFDDLKEKRVMVDVVCENLLDPDDESYDITEIYEIPVEDTSGDPLDLLETLKSKNACGRRKKEK